MFVTGQGEEPQAIVVRRMRHIKLMPGHAWACRPHRVNDRGKVGRHFGCGASSHADIRAVRYRSLMCRSVEHCVQLRAASILAAPLVSCNALFCGTGEGCSLSNTGSCPLKLAV